MATGPGDHLYPDLDGDEVYFLDRGISDSLLRKDIYGGEAEELLSGAEIWAGPVSDGSAFAWQDTSSQGCLRLIGQDMGRCIAAPRASSMALSGQKAVISDSGSTIRLLDFSTMRSRMLDSHDIPNMRYDPDIDGSTAVWVKERGYAGQYYEPLIVSCNLETGDTTYLSKLGGGTASGGGSKYSRRHPSISSGQVVYQQKLNEPGERWHIYAADPATYGVPLVQEPADQVSPSLSGNLVVYQDNRNGFFDENGDWVDNWDIYLKDLSTNIEQPVCNRPGDQINPVIKGNKVVWQDKRSGKWDIYAATLTEPPEPRLSLSIDSVFWGSYQDYLSGRLDVDYLVTNEGPGIADNMSIEKVVTSPADVSVACPLPAEFSQIEPGGQVKLELKYDVPSGISRFRTALFASCYDGSGAEIWFPAEPPG